MQLLPIFRKSPFARLLFFFAAGILSAHVFSIGKESFWLIASVIPMILLIMALLTRFCRSYSLNWHFGLQASLLLYITGILSMGVHVISGNRILNHVDKEYICLIRIIEPPDIKARHIKTTARIVSIFNGRKWSKENCKILVYFEKNALTNNLVPGSEILTKGIFKKIPDPADPLEFNYNKYLANRGIFLQIYLPGNAWKYVSTAGKTSLKVIAYQIRNSLLNTYGKIGLDTKEFGLLSALTLGYRNDLDTHTKHVFSQAGVMHVMALSGFNVGILVLVLNYLLGIVEVLNSGKVIKTVVIILVIWLFAVITGLSSSVTRATVMFTLVLIGKILHRQINTYNILFASAFFLLALSPGMLTDVSFQLSFAAVLGIIMFQPVIYRFLTFKNYLTDKIWKLFTVSCAAQFSTFPLTLYYFHQFPVYFWFTNLYVVPLVSLIICIAGAYLVLSFINPLAFVLGKALIFSLKVLFCSVEFIEGMPYALIDNLFIDTAQAIILVFVVLFICLFFLHRKGILLCIALTLSAVFQLENVSHNSRYRNQRICMVGNLKGTTAVIFISGREAALIANPRSVLTITKLTFAFHNFLIGHDVSDHINIITHEYPGMQNSIPIKDMYCRTNWYGENMIIGFSDKCIVVLSDNQFYNIPVKCRLKTDLVVVSGNLKPDLFRINEMLEMKLLVMDSSVKNYQVKCWENACEQLGIDSWNISEKGALKLTFKKRKLKN